MRCHSFCGLHIFEGSIKGIERDSPEDGKGIKKWAYIPWGLGISCIEPSGCGGKRYGSYLEEHNGD